MTDFQHAKSITRAYMRAFDSCAPGEKRATLKDHVTFDYHWRGLHPFHEQSGADAVIDTFWDPFTAAFSAIERRELIFFAGLNDCDNQATTWTCSMGHFKALFDAPWLGIPPTSKMVMIRYAEFHRIEGDKIAETALFIDILDIILQAGLWPLPPMTAAASHFPGPLTN
ncbi:MAG: ester cyclase, partial [Pseudomonadota bacterium]